MPFSNDLYYFAFEEDNTTVPALVLTHGAGGDYLHWHHAIRRLPGFRVFALDLPGHGKSKGVGRQDVFSYAQDIIDWLNRIGVYQAIFVGHSMGGAICQTIALEFPERVIGLGLVGTGARLRVHPELLENLSMEATFPTAINLIMQFAFADESNVDNFQQIKKQLLSNRPAVMYGDYLACNKFDALADIQNINAPTCIICGSQDQLTPPKYSEYLHEQIPGSTLTLIPESGHMVMLEQPEATAQVLQTFLKTL